ncbi:MAG: hypothetical protein KAI43_00010 [Candidatus Aureabacteria bacterium]|nr:hypothetical protein [Candidatus Auribacterota bacterium]
MKYKIKTVVLAFLFFVLAFTYSIPASFSDKAVTIKKFKLAKKTPSGKLSTSKTAGKTSSKWRELRLIFISRPKWIDEVTVKYFARVKSKDGGRNLAGEITYVNVPAGKAHLSSLFVHPTTLMRFGDIDAVHCEIWVKGKIRDMVDWPRKPQKKWWEMKAPMPGVLLTKFQTPFAYEGDYAALAIKAE